VSARVRRAAAGRSAALAAALATVVGAPGSAWAAAPPPTTYGEAMPVCAVTDPRLAQLSGLASRGGSLYAITDQASVVYTLDESCAVSAVAQLPDAVDVEDVEATADGLLWIGDIGGNREPRQDVSVLRFNPSSGNVTVLPLRYPDGPHDAEALLVTPSGLIVVVTKEESGVSRVFRAPAPADPAAVNQLELVADLDLQAITARTRGNGSVLVTGGSVSPDGTHVALRTYLDAFEWDAPDGDVVAAMTSGPPRVVPLPTTPQGEAISYDAQGLALFTGGEQLPSSVHRIDVARPTAASTDAPSSAVAAWAPVLRWVALAAGAAAVGAVLVSLLRSVRMRRRNGVPLEVRG